MKKLAIITTHPIQYYAPVFKLLAERKSIQIKVFYSWGTEAQQKFDPGFGKTISWDVPLLDGYDYEWLENTAKNAGSHHFNGIINPGIIDRIKQYQPDAILVFGWAYKAHLKVLRYFKGKIPVWFRGDSVLLANNNTVKRIMRYTLLKWVYQFVDHAFYVGTNNKNYFLRYGLKENQLSFAPHAIDNNRFETSRYDEVQALKNKLGIAETDVVLLFAGKLEEVKAPLLLVQTFVNLKNPGAHLLIAGEGPLKQQAKAIANNNKNIHFLGFQNQTAMPVIYQACDLFCLPSVSETWGLAVNEAMACRKAVLVSDKVGCAVDLVHQNVNGAIFASGNGEELQVALKKLTSSKELLDKYGEQSKQIIKTYNFDSIALAIENKLNAGT
ncbi:glycosyltransferase family 4 protein [Mucilaginibacter auburnensis]|uniref:Glycosyltransferase involved in cell wall biosynthesis n=1 Tax=Mucilaginibacter auburnensis TaxID=1457233 RepID=A0A2H9VMB4_9SPHI|nr:glycosyltransferase family 4 protein [Mucilaginibacter auburnensis]PJJ79462.1 glycosyltransferase involved in cell wall biosynthesis [Mucilaginibacter auburnensis]